MILGLKEKETSTATCKKKLIVVPRQILGNIYHSSHGRLKEPVPFFKLKKCSAFEEKGHYYGGSLYAHSNEVFQYV